VNHVAWSRVDQIAALSAYTVDDNERETNQVLFTNNEGELVANSSITHDFEATVFDWHPTERLLAIGWGDGMVSCWSVDGKNKPTSTFTNNVQHGSTITVLKWNPAGKRLVTGDKKGVVCVWQTDSRGGLNPIRQYRKKGSISALIYCVFSARGASGVDSTTGGPNATNGTMVVHNGNTSTNPAPAKVAVKEKPLSNQTPSFFFGTDRGALIYADDLGHCTDVQQLSSPIDTMLYFEERSSLVIITRSLLLTQYHVSDDGRVQRAAQVKLSVPQDVAVKGIQSIVWAGPGLLAAATEEKIIRLFDLATDESYNLSMNNALGKYMDRSDRVVCVTFSPVDRYLAVGTQLGIVAVWKFSGQARDVHAQAGGKAVPPTPTSPADWELLFRIHLNSPIMQLSWHGGRGTLACVTEDSTVILNESVMHAYMKGDLSVVQVSSTEVSLHIAGSLDPILVNTGMQMRGLAVGHSCFVCYSGKVAKVYRVDMQLQRFDALEPVHTSGMAMAIADASHVIDEVWFVAEGSVVKILNFAGTVKGTITFSEAEGVPMYLDLNGKFLAIVTNKGVIKIIDVHAPTKPKQLGSAGQFFSTKSTATTVGGVTTGGKGGESKSSEPVTSTPAGSASASAYVMPSADNTRIRSIKVNSSGTMVALLTDNVEGALKICHPDSKLHIYDRNKGAAMAFDFASHRRVPSSLHWDEQDDRLLSCEAVRARQNATGSNSAPAASTGVATSKSSKNKASNNDLEGEENSPISPNSHSSTAVNAASAEDTETVEIAETEVFLFFATSENNILMQDSFPRKTPYGALIGVNVPRLYFRNIIVPRKAEDNEDEPVNNKQVKIYSKVMRDFVGMDDVTESVKVALLDFSYNLTLGKLDEAYRVVKAINSPSIWENMAQMCVKTKRLDVAEVCLGNMGHARGAAAVRAAKKDGTNVAIGVLAIQLGLLDDAATIFRECGRFDMLNKLYQSAGLWDKAITTASNKDRIHLKTTHYQYARHLETLGLIDDAIEHYGLSGNSHTEVPRMLFQLDRVDELGDFVLQSDDPVLLKWWAAYLESIERYDKAKKYYSKARDYLSLVRIACFKGDFNKAAEIVAETNDRASAYHFARQLENQGQYNDAITFYASSGCYNHSIRLARAYNLDTELMRYALKSTPALMIECAVHFEQRREFDKAVQLYHKGGDIPRALDLCFRAGEDPSYANNTLVYDMLNTIAQDLGADSSPQTLARCAEFLVQHKQYERAIELYVMAKRYRSAVEMCLQNKVNINDVMVAALTPPETLEASERRDVLCDLAKALKKQGSFQLASKKYTQAGDRVRAIKCLVRSGDTKAVIQFASISRDPEIYKLAANYLQQMNWRESVDILKAITTFYTKAKAFVQLAAFYDSCGQVEIDEYSDYAKARDAMDMALKYLAKDTSRAATDMASSIEHRMMLIKKFLSAREAAKSDPSTMVAICAALLQEPELEEAIRAGDCLAMLVEHYFANKQYNEAYQYLQEMERRNIQLPPYVDAEIIDTVYKAVGHNTRNSSSNANKGRAASNNLGSQRDDQDDDYRGGRDSSNSPVRGPSNASTSGKSSTIGNTGSSGKGGGNRDRWSAEDEEEVADDIDEEIEEEEDEGLSPARGNNNNRGGRGHSGGVGSGGGGNMYYNARK